MKRSIKLHVERIGNLRLVHLIGQDGIENIKADIKSPKNVCSDNEVIGLPHYKPPNKIDHFNYKRKIGNKFEEYENLPFRFNVRISYDLRGIKPLTPSS